MLLFPNKTKHRKVKKRYIKSQTLNTKSYLLKFGFIGLKSLEPKKVTSRQIEAARQTLNRELSRKGKIWIRIFPHIPVSTKPSENRMGKGKGSLSHWVSVIKAGTIIFEVAGVPVQKAATALTKAQNKLPFSSQIIFL